MLCSAALDAGSGLPTEFLLFAAGITETTKGAFKADPAAIVAAQRAYGVRLMIDSEHASLDPEVFKARGDACDALGYFDVEARADGSVWAVSVEWTETGAERLRTKKAVYISPAFLATEEGRVTKIINAALTSMPATHRAPQLVAASKAPACTTSYRMQRLTSQPGKNMSPELFKKILAAIEAGDDKSGLLAEIASAFATGEETPSADPATDPLAATADPAAEDPNKPAAVASLTARLNKLEAERAESVKKLSARVAELESEKQADEKAERVALVGELVTLGREDPATAWDGEPEKMQPSEELRTMPIARLRARVELFRKSPRSAPLAPPARKDPAVGEGRAFTTSAGVVTLSASEIKNCEEMGAKPEAYAENKAIREAARGRKDK